MVIRISVSMIDICHATFDKTCRGPSLALIIGCEFFQGHLKDWSLPKLNHGDHVVGGNGGGGDVDGDHGGDGDDYYDDLP